MQIDVNRVQLDSDCTIGEMTVDGVFEAFTLEDVVRPAGAPKVYGQTAIPAGRYEVTITFSPHFQRQLPLLLNVPGFEGIRIHPGNVPADTDGCILVGQGRNAKSISASRAAFDALFPKIQAAVAAHEPVFLTIA